jgi:hypothetical protein
MWKASASGTGGGCAHCRCRVEGAEVDDVKSSLASGRIAAASFGQFDDLRQEGAGPSANSNKAGDYPERIVYTARFVPYRACASPARWASALGSCHMPSRSRPGHIGPVEYGRASCYLLTERSCTYSRASAVRFSTDEVHLQKSGCEEGVSMSPAVRSPRQQRSVCPPPS